MIGELLTSAEVAERLRISKRTVARMAGDGTLEPAETVPGGRGIFLFHPGDVAALEARRRKIDAPVRAAALREAAETWEGAYGDVGDVVYAAAWLRERADMIEHGSI